MGVAVPFIATLGYVWVDTFRPQEVAYVLLKQMPVSLIMGGTAIGGYFLVDRRSPPPVTLAQCLIFLMAIWVTATIIWAEVPAAAWTKWDWAFKTLVFGSFIPLVIRSRVQIEAFIQTYVFALAANIIPFGLKTAISGGGYGVNLGLSQGNSGLAEGGLLSTICLMAVPLCLFLGKHSLLMPKWKLVPLGYLGIAGLAVITAIGTYERSALVGIVVLGGYMFIRSRRKVLFGTLAVCIAVGMIYATSGAWNKRISSISEFQTENSALTRLLVWQWTFNYSLSHPLGGGFEAYRVGTIVLPPDASNPGGLIVNGRAYHSCYFEVLGEQGFPGLAIFLIAVGSSFLSLLKLARRAKRDPELIWIADLSDALQAGIAVFMTCGAFVGIAFQPMIWFFVALSISARAYMKRIERAALVTSPSSWRLGRGTAPAALPGASPDPGPLPAGRAGVPNWRHRALTPGANGQPR